MLLMLVAAQAIDVFTSMFEDRETTPGPTTRTRSWPVATWGLQSVGRRTAE
jgi:hypothetical protein